jgi:hypothetical protein
MHGVFQWRRGLLLAGIHLAICVPLIVWEQATRWDWVRSQENLPPLQLAPPAPPPPPGGAVKLPDEGETVSFNPCNPWRHTSWQERVIVFGELPAAAFSQWGEPCPSSWSLAGLLGMGWSNHDSRRKEVEFSTGLCGLIALQWLFIGGFPLIHPRRWYWEPGALITICTCTVFLALLAPLLWLAWLMLLAWRLLQGCYRAVVFAWRFFRRNDVETPVTN